MKDPNIKEAAKNLLANMNKVKIDPSVWSNLGKFLKDSGIKITTEEEKNIKDSLYEIGDVIVSYKDPDAINFSKAKNNVEEKSNLLNIGTIHIKETGVKFILKHSDGSNYEIAYEDSLDSSKFIKLYGVRLNDNEIKKIQEQFDRIDYQKMPHLLNIGKSVVDFAVNIKQRKDDGTLNNFNIENILDKQYLKDASAIGTTATKEIIPIDEKNTTTQNTPKQLNNIKILTMLQKKENQSYFNKISDIIKENVTSKENSNDFELTADELTLQYINIYIYGLIFNKEHSKITEKSGNKQVEFIDDNNNKINNIIEIKHIENNDPFEELKLLLLERLCLEINSIINVIKTITLINQIDGIKTFIDKINAQIDIYNTNSENFNNLQKFWKEIKTHFNNDSNKYKYLDLAEILSEDKINNNLNVFENFDKNINDMTNFYKENIREKSLYTKNISYKKLAENLNINLIKYKSNKVNQIKQFANNKALPYTVILLKPLTKIDELSDVDTKAKPKYVKTYEKYFSNTSLTDKTKAYGNTLKERGNITDIKNNKNITKIIENINNEKNKISETIDKYNNETLKDKNSWFKYFSKEQNRPIKRILGDKTAVINKHLDDMDMNMKYLWTIIVHEEKIKEVIEKKIKKDIENYNTPPANVESFTKFLDDLKVKIDKLDDKDLIKQEYKKQFPNVSKTK